MNKKLIEDFVQKTKRKFGDKLKCILLYGSRAKGTSTEESDWDFFLVVKDLPEKISSRQKEFIPIKKEIIKRYGGVISVVPFTPEEIRNEINPLIYGILTGYTVLYGDEFWKDYLQRLKPKLKEKDPVFVGEGREWRPARLI